MNDKLSQANFQRMTDNQLQRLSVLLNKRIARDAQLGQNLEVLLTEDILLAAEIDRRGIK